MREVAETFPASLCRMQWIAYFNDSQRQASMDAGTIAGLNVMRIIKEPADAAMAYGFSMETNYNGENSLLIIDLGGGIFIEELIVEVRGTTGDCHLFPATYVPPLRGGCGARRSRMSRRTRQRENPLVTERYLTAEPHGSSEQVSCPPSRL